MDWRSWRWEAAEAVRAALRDGRSYYRRLAEKLSPECRSVLEMLASRSDRLVVVSAEDYVSFCQFYFVFMPHAFELLKGEERAGDEVPLSSVTYYKNSDSVSATISKRFKGRAVAPGWLCSLEDGDHCSTEVDCRRGIATTHISFTTAGLRKLKALLDRMMPASVGPSPM